MAHALGTIGEHGRGKPVAGLVDEFPSEVLRLAYDPRLIDRVLQFDRIEPWRSSDRDIVHALVFALAAIGVRVEVSDVGAFNNRSHGFFRAGRKLGHGDGAALDHPGLQSSHGGAGRAAGPSPSKMIKSCGNRRAPLSTPLPP